MSVEIDKVNERESTEGNIVRGELVNLMRNTYVKIFKLVEEQVNEPQWLQ
jgi:hypothetical protein